METTDTTTQRYDYQLLDRLKQDCEYYIEHPHDKHLWAGGVEAQIAKMRELYDKLKEKPEWLTLEDIARYERRMNEARQGLRPTRPVDPMDVILACRADPGVDSVREGGNPLGRYVEAVTRDGRGVLVQFIAPDTKLSDNRGMVEVTFNNRPMSEWRFDDTDQADRSPLLVFPTTPDALDAVMREIRAFERETQPQLDDYAPDIAREGRREQAGRMALERFERTGMTKDGTELLRRIVDEAYAHDPDGRIGEYKVWPSSAADEQAGDGLSENDIAEKRYYGGWNPNRDDYMHINHDGDWTGMSQDEADRMVWDHRDGIIDAAARDIDLSDETIRRMAHSPHDDAPRRLHRNTR